MRGEGKGGDGGGEAGEGRREDREGMGAETSRWDLVGSATINGIEPTRVYTRSTLTTTHQQQPTAAS